MGGSRAQGCLMKGFWREMDLTVQWSEQLGGGNELWRIKLPDQEVGRTLGRWDRPEQEPQRERGTMSRARTWPAGDLGQAAHLL